MTDNITVRPIRESDINAITTAYKQSADSHFHSHISRCFQENLTSRRITFVAFTDNEVAGYVHVIFKPEYPWYIENGIPEINELEVIESRRRRGIGRKLLETCESYARSRNYPRIGLGVGLYKSYGSAQRLYTKTGYVFDGNGLMYKNAEVQPGHDVFVDDDLLLYMYKELN